MGREPPQPFREGRVPNVPNQGLKLGTRNMAREIQDLPGRWVALVTRKEFDFGVLRVWNALSESAVELEQNAFYDFDEALDWLDS